MNYELFITSLLPLRDIKLGVIYHLCRLAYYLVSVFTLWHQGQITDVNPFPEYLLYWVALQIAFEIVRILILILIKPSGCNNWILIHTHFPHRDISALHIGKETMGIYHIYPIV